LYFTVSTIKERMMISVNPYLNFPGNTEEAFAFYGKVFGTEPYGILRYRDMGGEAMGLTGDDLDKVAHMAVPLSDKNMLMGTDVTPTSGQPPVVQGNNHYIMLETESAEEARKVFDGLVAGGTAEMPLEKTEWAELYGMCRDKFGVLWMVNFTGSVTFGSPEV
jgi:PhnB protein